MGTNTPLTSKEVQELPKGFTPTGYFGNRYSRSPRRLKNALQKSKISRIQYVWSSYEDAEKNNNSIKYLKTIYHYERY